MVSSLFKIETLYTPIWQKENQSTRHINRGIRINPELHQQGNNKTESCAHTLPLGSPGSNPGRPRELVQNDVAMSRCTN